MDDKILNLSFNLWASSEEEVDELKREICAFIDYHGQQGRKVSARKLTEAIRKWQSNPFVKNTIDNHFR